MNRRKFLQAALAAPVVAAVPAFPSTPAFVGIDLASGASWGGATLFWRGTDEVYFQQGALGWVTGASIGGVIC